MRQSIAAALVAGLTFGAAGCGGVEREAPKITATVAGEDGVKAKTSDLKSNRAAEIEAANAAVARDVPGSQLPPLQTDKKDRVRPTETVAVAAETLRNELQKDRAIAAQKYQSVEVELSGVVRTVGSRGPETFVTLDAGPGLGLMCVFADEKQPWAKLSRGQKVKLRGLWPETLGQDGLVQCKIADLGPSTAQEMSAESLAEMFVKDKDGVRKKYDEKPLVIMGIVTDMRRNELGAVRVFLKGTDSARVDCGFNAADRKEAESVRMGQRVLLTGEFAALESNNEPALRGCRLIQ